MSSLNIHATDVPDPSSLPDTENWGSAHPFSLFPAPSPPALCTGLPIQSHTSVICGLTGTLWRGSRGSYRLSMLSLPQDWGGCRGSFSLTTLVQSHCRLRSEETESGGCTPNTLQSHCSTQVLSASILSGTGHPCHGCHTLLVILVTLTPARPCGCLQCQSPWGLQRVR